MDKHLSCPLRKILGTIFKVDERRTSTNGVENKKTHNVLHIWNNIDGLYESKKEGGRGPANIEDNVDIPKRRFEDYIKKRKEKQVTAIRNNTNNSRIKRTTMCRKQKWEEKLLYGHFKR